MKNMELSKMENINGGDLLGCIAGISGAVVGTALLNPLIGGLGLLVIAAECGD